MKKRIIELVASNIHQIYQKEAKRQNDVRHADKYEDLPESIKEYDRVLARWIMDLRAGDKQSIGLSFLEWYHSDNYELVEDAIERITGVKV